MVCVHLFCRGHDGPGFGQRVGHGDVGGSREQTDGAGMLDVDDVTIELLVRVLVDLVGGG